MTMRDDIAIIVNEARAIGLDISPADVVWDGANGPTIDGMPADEWFGLMLER